MKQTIKRMLACVLAVVMVICAVPITNAHAQGKYDIKIDVEFSDNLIGGEMDDGSDVLITLHETDGTLKSNSVTSNITALGYCFVNTRNISTVFYDVLGVEDISIDFCTADLPKESEAYKNFSESSLYFSFPTAKFVVSRRSAGTDNDFSTYFEFTRVKSDAESVSEEYAVWYLGLGTCYIYRYSYSHTQKMFPDGYDFNEDSYNFENYMSMIPYGYFKTMYGKAKGYELWKNEWLQGGLCFGFSYTTAAFNNSLPPCSSIRNLSKSSTISIGNNSLSVATYIKYAHIYQLSMEFQGHSVWSDAKTIYDLVKQTTMDNVLMVTIGMSHKTDGGHRVLAIGIDGNDILIDDPNFANEIQRITINEDGSWSFSGLDGWNSNTCAIRYSTDIAEPYKFLRSLNTLTANEAFIDDSTIDSFSSSYEADTLSEDYLLLSVNSNECNIANTDISKIEAEYNNDTDSSEQTDLYWLTDDKTVTITGITGDSELELAGNDNIIGVTTADSSSVELTVDEETDIITTSFDTVTGNEYTLSFKSFDENSDVIALTAFGTACADTVTATQTETGFVVTGISDGTVTLSKDNEVVETQTISNATSDIQITYDKTGESDDISLDYEHTHTDADHDGNCDICGEIMESVKNCPHICHKTGFLGFIWKILRVFCKLFGIYQYCECGIKHY